MPLPGHGSTVYSYRQLEQLWLAAGGSKSLAPIMAAIAEAESGGNPNAYNPSGATGLWQILGAVRSSDQSRLTDPMVNAREAVLKYKEQSLSAWTTYTSGAYKKFLQSGAAGSLATGEGFVKEVEKFIGTPYVWGGENPQGFDCSGLVKYGLEKMGLKNVPRTSEEQWAWVHKITRGELKPGDLVFSQWPGDNSSPGHVQIYVGNNMVVGADSVNVEKVPLSSDAGHIVGYGRPPGIFGQGAGGGPGAPGSSSGGGFDWSRWLNDLGQGLADLNAGASPTNFLESLTGDLQGGGSILGVAGPLAGISETLFNFEQHIAWFFQPNHWVRIFCGAIGTGLVLTGVITMTRTGRAYSVNVPQAGAVPAPGGQVAPALGIAEVTIGAILLFVAFHNLPASVDNFGGLVSYLQGQVQSGGTVG